jgi:hypothetical protein
MPIPERTDDDAAKAADDGPSLPELLAQAAGLGAALTAQQAAFASDLHARLASAPDLLQPGPAQDPGADQEVDLPKIIERLQGEMAQAVAQLGGLAAGFGVAVPAGAGAGEVLALLGAAAGAQLDQHAAALGQPPAPAAASAAAPPADALPDLAKLIEKGQAEHVAALAAMAELFKAHGIDPVDPMGALAGMMPDHPAAPTAPPVGFPGAEQLAAMQGDAARLKQLTDELFAKLIPR